MPRPRGAYETLRVFGDHEWMADAACAGPPRSKVDFFLESVAAPAKAICATCVVRTDCLDYALAIKEHHGIWGGMTPEERRDITVED